MAHGSKKSWQLFLQRRRRAAGIKPWQLFAALGIVLIFIFAVATPQGQKLSGLSGTNPLPGNFVSVTKPVQFTCFDALSGSNCGAVTVTLYQGSSSLVLETLTASASGVATTGNSYATGTAMTVKISGNSKAAEFLPFTVPGMDPNSAISSSNNVISTYAVTLGAWSVLETGTNGATTFVSGTTYNLKTFTGTTTTVTTVLTESTSNAGYKSSYDVSNLLNQYFVVQIDDGGGASSSTQYATVTGLPNLVKLGNTNYYFNVCPDGLSGNGFGTTGAFNVVSNGQSAGSASSSCTGAASSKTIGTQVFGGSLGFSWTIAAGSLSGTNIETFSIKVYAYGDPGYFVVNGNLGPNAAQQGSTITLKISNN